ncbi:MAG: glycosyltransferase family 2 protein [Desulfopila sp.]
MASSPSSQNTCAVVVTYHPDAGFAERLYQLEKQFAQVVIVDNGSHFATVEMLRALSQSVKIFLVENRENRGIGAALNQGIEYARQLGFQWLATFDQDTFVYADYLTSLAEIYCDSGEEEIVLGSNYREIHKKQNRVHCQKNGRLSLPQKTLITSGMLLPLSLVEKIGGFREDYFIDSVDHEFCLRAKHHGYRSVISCRVLMEHCIGPGGEKMNWLQRRFTRNHPASRKYYIARNSIVTAREYLVQEPLWCIGQGLQVLYIVFAICLFERSKQLRCKAFLSGLIHGLIGRMGPIDRKLSDDQH